jgi:hypothetical protein
MKTDRRLLGLFSFPDARSARRLLLAATLVIGNLSPAADSAPAPARAKEYNMFVGADLFLVKEQQPYPILYASGKNLEVKIGSEIKQFKIYELPNLRATPNLKLSRSLVTVTGYKHDRGFTSGNNPHLRWARDSAIAAEMDLNARNASAPKFDPFKDRITGLATFLGARGQPAPPAEATTIQGPTFSPDTSGLVDNATEKLTSENYDLLRVEFQLSSSKRIADPYMAIITDVSDPSRPGTVLRWFYIDTLRDIDDHPQKIRVEEAGFPPGFKVLTTAVHIYSRGQEVATNQAERRLEMTLDEAHEYLAIQHLASHKNSTVPPSLALAELPTDFRQRATPNQLKQKLEIKVDANGKVTGLAPLGPATAIDPYIAETVRNFRFNPALEKGAPIAGQLSVELSELVHY